MRVGSWYWWLLMRVGIWMYGPIEDIDPDIQAAINRNWWSLIGDDDEQDVPREPEA